MASGRILVRMEHIFKYFPGVRALDDVRFTLCAGEVHALLGENGAGKSTLIKVLTGVEKKDGGSVFFEGKEINPQSTYEAQAIGISTVYQEINLCPNLSVAENIYIGREILKNGFINWKEINKKAALLLRDFNLNIDVTKSLDSYSVAVQQMVAIARAVDISAKVLILDEPTSSLSRVEVKELFKILRMLKEKNIGIVFVTHFLDQVYEISDTITVLRNGSYIGTYPVRDLPKPELITKMVGREYYNFHVSPPELRNAEDNKEQVFRLQDASSEFIHNISLDMYRGDILGFSGLLGSGRSEILRMIFGSEPALSGSCEIKGNEVVINNEKAAIMNGIALCPEDRNAEGVIGELTIRENIILALQTKRGVLKAVSRAEAGRLADMYIQKLAIKTPSANQLVKNLSGGNKQKVVLARWLATDPFLFMLDEPTRGIDIRTKAEIQKIVIELAAGGMATVFVSSELDEMLNCCNRMIVLRDKKQTAELTGKGISEAAVMKYLAGEKNE
ncbi:sugar ABC transporter ATP-binding protein [Treponema sp.]|uniref:sugar ABC transporter ATP-binding protein n=1 Tax=Treponema sp. TaxID=166 RepID=UPI003FA29AA7